MNLDANEILERFHDLTPWTRFDEWSGVVIELPLGVEGAGRPHGGTTSAGREPQTVCAFFGEDQEADYKLLILRGSDPSFQYLQYRSGDWIPEFGLDFATTDGIKVNIVDDQVDSYVSHKPGQPAEPLRLDEKQLMFEVFDAINTLAEMVDEDKIPVLGETEDYCYHLWKVAKTWRADVRDFPDEEFVKYEPLQIQESRLKRIGAAGLLQDGVWEASSFYLPATRFQGDQEVFVQCAGVAERNAGLLGLVTLEAHADPEQEIAEALIGSIEKQKRIPQFLIVKNEKVAERLLPILETLGIHVKLRKRLRDLAHIREELIEEFPEDDSETEESSES